MVTTMNGITAAFGFTLTMRPPPTFTVSKKRRDELRASLGARQLPGGRKVLCELDGRRHPALVRSGVHPLELYLSGGV